MNTHNPRPKPINLNLFRLHFPVMAIVSILHRITGALLFLAIPLLLYWLQISLISESSYHGLARNLTHPLHRGMVALLLGIVIFHGWAGIRHLVMDCGIWEGRVAGRVTAWTVIAAAILSTVLLLCRLW